MSKGRGLQEILDQAKQEEKKYDWAKAAELYQQALGTVGKGEPVKRGELQKRRGYSFYRAAFQAETQGDFKRLIGLSAEAYDGAAALYEEQVGSKTQARLSLCKAKAAYSRSWLAEDSADRTALLDECRTLNKNAAKAYEETGDQVGQGHACNELLRCLSDRYYLVQEAQELKNIMEEALTYGKQAIHALAETADERALTRANYQLSWGYINSVSVYESIEKHKDLRQQALPYAEKALEIAGRIGDKYLIGMSDLALGYARWSVRADAESALKQLEKALDSATMTRDALLRARVCERQGHYRLFNAATVEDPDKRREEYNKVIQTAKDAIARSELLSYPYISSYYHHPTGYVKLARDETDLEKKRGLLMKAAEIARKYLPRAQRSGSPLTTVLVLHPLSAALDSLATIETETGEKRRLLTQAAEHREAAIKMYDRVYPFDYWDQGMLRSRLAGLKVELAKLEADGQKKKDLLTAAAVTMEESMDFIKKGLTGYTESPALYSIVGAAQDMFGAVVNQLYLLTGEKTHLKRALQICEDAVETWGKAGQQSRIAETHWQMAKIYNQLGEHLKAAQAFAAASKGYAQAARKLPQLKAFFTDHAVYMQAWSEIENARHCHVGRQYGQAKDHYLKAAVLHKKTERWRYLSSNYLAWACLEEAEDLSRGEHAEEATSLFEQAGQRFAETRKSIEAQLETIEDRDEKEMARELVKASNVRHDYCLGRVALEEAKILDRQGNHVASSRKYAAAAETFRKAVDTVKHESDRQELRPLICLSQAWQMMTRAEAEASPDLYLEASQLFNEAKEHSVDERAKVLALGHSCFCEALEGGTRFETSREPKAYSAAKTHLEAAANHYIKAGFKNAAEYARATHRLLDAYMYTHKAEMETDPTKKAQFYRMAEKLLQTSAGSYMKAKHPEKGEEVQRLLESVREERQLAMSLTEVLHAPTITSTTTSFSTPTPTHEQAVGLERFEHADIQANLILRVKEARVGEDINLAIELVNAGKAPALLIKVDGVIPQGFEIREVPEMYTFEDSYINMKGKRLNPLKTEDVKVVVNPRSKGTHIIKPRILYIDETGKYKSHEPEPVTIIVKELGIGGWIKGER